MFELFGTTAQRILIFLSLGFITVLEGLGAHFLSGFTTVLYGLGPHYLLACSAVIYGLCWPLLASPDLSWSLLGSPDLSWPLLALLATPEVLYSKSPLSECLSGLTQHMARYRQKGNPIH